MNSTATLAFLAGVLVCVGLLGLLGFARRRREAKVLKGYFLLGLSGLLAKVAMADGRVTDDETALAEKTFAAMKLSAAERALCIGNFVVARRDGLDVRDHANRFLANANAEAAACLYAFLWRLSRADGTVDPAEDALLERIAKCLGLAETAYVRGKAGEEPAFERARLISAGVPQSVVDMVA